MRRFAGKDVRRLPLANYCKKCRAEVAAGESCPYCGAKLAQTGERVSFGVTRSPAHDWFAWNGILRVALPALGLAFAAVLAAEWAAYGARGVTALLERGLAGLILTALGATLAAVWLVLALQGRESVHYVLDRDGARQLTYLVAPTRLQLWARLTSPAALSALDAGDDALEGYTLVSRVILPWERVRRARVWRETRTLLLYRPAFWLALAVRCPAADFELATACARKRLKRFVSVDALPEAKKEANV